MKKLLIFTNILLIAILSLQLSNQAEEREIASAEDSRQIIMVIDTGLNMTKEIEPYVCEAGHKSYIFGQKALEDHNGHGSNVAGLIAKGMNPKKQCLVIVKFWDQDMNGVDTIELVREALRYAIALKPAFINMSLTGRTPDHLEMRYVNKLISMGVNIAVAAGNENRDLDKSCRSFPACYKINSPHFRVVGSNTVRLEPLSRTIILKGPRQEVRRVNGKYYKVFRYSNYGKRITNWENGTLVGSPKMTGTSQATAISMSKWVQGK